MSAYPEEVKKYIFAHYLGTGPKAMAEQLNDKFGCDFTTGQIKSFYHNHNLNSGCTGRYQKGCVPANKGKHVSPEHYAKSKGTMFKPRHRPHNAVPVGTIVKRDDGYYQIKVEEPNKWKLCQINEWEKAYGPIPEGCVLCFKDGNKANYYVDNLVLITHAENAAMNQLKLRSSDPELTEVGIAVAKLHLKAKQKGKPNVSK